MPEISVVMRKTMVGPDAWGRRFETDKLRQLSRERLPERLWLVERSKRLPECATAVLAPMAAEKSSVRLPLATDLVSKRILQVPALFDRLDVRFEYPENWKVDEDSGDGDSSQVIISSPETAFWQLSKHPAETDLEDLFDEALSTLRSLYQEIEAEPASESLEGRTIRGFNVNFYCLDFTNTCWLRGFEAADAVYLLLCQAEDSEFQKTSPVFLAMLASVLRNLKSA